MDGFILCPLVIMQTFYELFICIICNKSFAKSVQEKWTLDNSLVQKVKCVQYKKLYKHYERYTALLLLRNNPWWNICKVLYNLKNEPDKMNSGFGAVCPISSHLKLTQGLVDKHFVCITFVCCFCTLCFETQTLSIWRNFKLPD